MTLGELPVVSIIIEEHLFIVLGILVGVKIGSKKVNLWSIGPLLEVNKDDVEWFGRMLLGSDVNPVDDTKTMFGDDRVDLLAVDGLMNERETDARVGGVTESHSGVGHSE